MTKMWMQTHSGVAFDLLSPRADDVRVADVAHHLSRIGRFAGATLGDRIYTVAQHSILVGISLYQAGAAARTVREGLLHDAAEAYYGDITSPVKRALAEVCGFSALRLLTDPIDRVVREALGLPPVESPIVKRHDLIALAVEQRDLMSECARDWELSEIADRRLTLTEVMLPDVAETAFLAHLAALDAQIEGEVTLLQ